MTEGPRTVRLDALRAPELRALPTDRTVFLLPVGPIEDHGEALPLALDLEEAEAICKACAEILTADGWTVVITPRAALGVDSDTSEIAIRVRPHVLRDYLVDFCDSLFRSGFRYFIAVSGNAGPRQLTTIEDAGKFLRKRHLRFGIFPKSNTPLLVSGSSVVFDSEEKSMSPFAMLPPEHGGARDASIALALASGANQALDHALIEACPAVAAEGGLFSRWRKWRRGEVRGYWGNPKLGTAADGHARILEKARTISVKFKAATEGGNGRHIFKSWYSVVPSNQSLFRVWLLVGLLAILLGAWTFYSLQLFLVGADFAN
ncbi:MAG: creatininase family protein [Cryobacterium sp.]|nr:creatininase family protein [Oligoflexia bacterium]